MNGAGSFPLSQSQSLPPWLLGAFCPPVLLLSPPFPPSAPIWVLSTWVQTSPHSPFPNPVQSGASGLWQGTS